MAKQKKIWQDKKRPSQIWPGIFYPECDPRYPYLHFFYFVVFEITRSVEVKSGGSKQSCDVAFEL